MATVRQHKMKLLGKLEIGKAHDGTAPYEIFMNVPEVFKLTKKDEGKRIWLASEYKTTHVKLDEIHENHYDIHYVGEKKYRAIYPEEAVLHPDEIDRERLEKHGYTIKDGRKK